jgi:hypothetical protein
MSEAPTDGRRVIAVCKFGNTYHARYNPTRTVIGTLDLGPRGWVNVKTGHRLEVRFECFAAWVEAPPKHVVPGVQK